MVQQKHDFSCASFCCSLGPKSGSCDLVRVAYCFWPLLWYLKSSTPVFSGFYFSYMSHTNIYLNICFVWGKSFFNEFLLAKVLRRTSYKGGVSNDASLPVDGATVMGIITIIGSMLAGPSLSTATLRSACNILASMEEKAKLPSSLALLPNLPEFCVVVDNNCVNMKSLKEIMKKLGIDWNRWDVASV